MIRSVVRIAVAAVLAGGLLAAQPPRGPRFRPDESWSERRVQFFATRLSLTDSQKQQALTLFQAAEQQSQPIEERLWDARHALRDAARRGASTAEIDQLAATVGTLTGQLAAIEAKTEAAFFTSLSAEQRQKLSEERHRSRPPRPDR